MQGFKSRNPTLLGREFCINLPLAMTLQKHPKLLTNFRKKKTAIFLLAMQRCSVTKKGRSIPTSSESHYDLFCLENSVG